MSQALDYTAFSSFAQRPSENIRYLISRQLPKLIDIAITECLQFVNTSQTKGKALQQLKYTVLIAQTAISEHLQKIIKAVIKIWQQDIDGVEHTIKQIMSLVGHFTKSSYYLPLMMDLMKQEEIRNSTKNTAILLTLFNNMLRTSEDIESHLAQILKIVGFYDAQFVDNDEGLAIVADLVVTMVGRLNTIEQAQVVSIFFTVLLNVEATKSIPASKRAQAKKSMEMLAKKSGFQTVADLHSNEVVPVLQKLISSKDYLSWTKTSRNRFKFDTIVRNCRGQAKKFMPEILTILEYCISVDCDVEIRMDTLVLLEEIFSEPELRDSLKENGLRILRNILNVAIKWKVGKPQIKIRKAGVINMMKLIDMQLITEEELLESLDDFLPQLKTCISDDWAPELRFTCCEFLEKYLLATKDNIQVDQLKQLYVILLERLDDSQDPIRIKITIPINLFFMARHLKISPSMSSTLEYMINAIFVHYDDTNQQIRDAINVSLRYAARVDPSRVIKCAESNRLKMKHKEQCVELIDYCREVIEDNKL